MDSLNHKKNTALKRYLERHIEPGLPNAPLPTKAWQHALVIPAYDESPGFLAALSSLSAKGRALVIVVLNRPDSNPNNQINSTLRNAIATMKHSDTAGNPSNPIYKINESLDLFCYDLEQLSGASPSSQGVGLARKIGCDIALLWQSQGAISGDWIFSTDADAALPMDYFSRLDRESDAVAAVYPFVHIAGISDDVNRATALYELRLQQYVLGLIYAQSPHAFHTLGSCVAVKGLHYAQVRGYPKRAGAEDFYLLNKLAKLGPIASLGGECITLQSRVSNRIPFGTGPATHKIIEEDQYDKSPLFYHPQHFEALKYLLKAIPYLQEHDPEELPRLLMSLGLSEQLAHISQKAALSQNLHGTILHCRKHGKSPAQFLAQFHQWFDGFRTLKFIHQLRDIALPMQDLSSVFSLQPKLFPPGTGADTDIESLRTAIRKHWRWSSREKMSSQEPIPEDSLDT